MWRCVNFFPISCSQLQLNFSVKYPKLEAGNIYEREQKISPETHKQFVLGLKFQSTVQHRFIPRKGNSKNEIYSLVGLLV